jgi:hypothetical protein
MILNFFSYCLVAEKVEENRRCNTVYTTFVFSFFIVLELYYRSPLQWKVRKSGRINIVSLILEKSCKYLFICGKLSKSYASLQECQECKNYAALQECKNQFQFKKQMGCVMTLQLKIYANEKSPNKIGSSLSLK